jgi:FSR family fosmidomycin resistance protein-like MFS transporter
VSVGGLAAPVIGALADATSLRTALMPLIALPVLGRLLLCGLREPTAPAGAAPAPDAYGDHPRATSV